MARTQGGLIGLGIAALIAGGVSGLNQLPTRAAPTAPITFGTPTILDPTHTAGEPTIQVSPANDGTVYGSAPTGTGTQRSIWEASADGGQTFRLVNVCTPGTNQVGVPSALCAPPNAAVGQTSPPGGGDTDMRLDHTGENYFLDLYALACNRAAKTGILGPDHGATSTQAVYGCGTGNSATDPSPNCTVGTPPTCRPDGADRQWLAVFDPKLTGVTSTAIDAAQPNLGHPIIYQEYNNLQTTQTGCSYWVKSTDGLNYSPANNDNGNFGCDGYPSVDQLTGKVFEASDGGGNTLKLNIGTPVDAAGDLCFLDDPALTTVGTLSTPCPVGTGLITVKAGLAGSPANLFTVSSMDTGRNLHITYAVSGAVSSGDGGATGTSSYQVFTTVASAASGWTIWAPPVQISQAPSNVNVFPWMVAGGPGLSDSVWYGNNLFIDPSTNANQKWFVYMSQVAWPLLGDGQTVDVPSLVGGTKSAAVTAPIQVSPHPNHYNSICLQGTGCIASQGDRNLADFFTVQIDATGAAEVMYDDTSNGLVQNPAAGTGLVDHPGAPVITIARQSGGPGLLGSLVSGTSNAPSFGMNDPFGAPNGDALFPVIGGTNQPAFDFSGNKLALSGDGGTLTVTMNVDDLTGSTIAADATTVTGTQFLQYVTRWQMGNTIYYAMMETTPTLAGAGTYSFFAGTAASYDACSVSACDPHAVYYPEAGIGANTIAAGTVDCTFKPCTVTIPVPVADVGTPTQNDLLEEVGSYALASAHLQGTNPTTGPPPNAFVQTDNLPLEVDGICCFNFQGGASTAGQVPETPWLPLLPVIGVALIGAGVLRRRRAVSSASL